MVFEQHVSSNARFCCSAHCTEFVPLGSSFQASLPHIRNTWRMELTWSYFRRLMPGIDQSEPEHGTATMASDGNITNRWSLQGQYFKVNSTPNCSPSFVGLFSTLQYRNINTDSKTTPNYHRNWKTRWMKTFWPFALTSHDFATYGTAHTEQLCVLLNCKCRRW